MDKKTLTVILLFIVGLLCGIGPFSDARHITDDLKKNNVSTKSSSNDSYQPSFKGSSYSHYKCSVNGCLCTKYEPISTYNTNCANCGYGYHEKDDHYEFQ